MSGIFVKSLNRFSIAEENLICIFRKDNRKETINALKFSIAHIDDEELIAMIEHTANKLEGVSDEEFDNTEFIMTQPD